MEWCIRQLWCSSVLIYNISRIAYNHHTDIYPLSNIYFYLQWESPYGAQTASGSVSVSSRTSGAGGQRAQPHAAWTGGVSVRSSSGGQGQYSNSRQYGNNNHNNQINQAAFNMQSMHAAVGQIGSSPHINMNMNAYDAASGPASRQGSAYNSHNSQAGTGSGQSNPGSYLHGENLGTNAYPIEDHDQYPHDHEQDLEDSLSLSDISEDSHTGRRGGQHLHPDGHTGAGGHPVVVPGNGRRGQHRVSGKSADNYRARRAQRKARLEKGDEGGEQGPVLSGTYTDVMQRAELYAHKSNPAPAAVTYYAGRDGSITAEGTSMEAYRQNQGKNKNMNMNAIVDGNDCMPSEIDPRSLLIWNRFFENALAAKMGEEQVEAQDPLLQGLERFEFPALGRHEWPADIGEEEFRRMVGVITDQPSCKARDNNIIVALLHCIKRLRSVTEPRAATAEGEGEVEGERVEEGEKDPHDANLIQVATKLLQLGADPDGSEMTLSRAPLLQEQEGGGQGVPRSPQPRQGRTSLHYAAHAGNVDMLALLLDHGADPERADPYGCTPLMMACAYGRVGVVTFLLESAAQVDVQDSDGNSALHLCAHGNLGSINIGGINDVDRAVQNYLLLLDYGAGHGVYNKSGQHSLAYAAKLHSRAGGLTATLELLEKLYADSPPPAPPVRQMSPSVAHRGLQHQQQQGFDQEQSGVLLPPPVPSQVSMSNSPVNMNKPLWTAGLTVNTVGGGGVAQGRAKPSPTFTSPDRSSHHSNPTQAGEGGGHLGLGGNNNSHNSNSHLGDSPAHRAWKADVLAAQRNTGTSKSMSLLQDRDSSGATDSNEGGKGNKSNDSNSKDGGVGQAVVGAFFGAASSLIGVTMSMFNEDGNNEQASDTNQNQNQVRND